jgi:hypothetical protein
MTMSCTANWILALKRVLLHLDSGGLSPASHRRGSGSTPVHSVWHLWRTKLNWYRFFFQALWFSSVSNFPPLLHTQTSLIHYWHVILATDSSVLLGLRPDHSCCSLKTFIMNSVLGKETCERAFGIHKRNSFLQPIICNWYVAFHTDSLKLLIQINHYLPYKARTLASKVHWTDAYVVLLIFCFTTLPFLLFPKEFNPLTPHYDVVSSLRHVSVSQVHTRLTPAWSLRKVAHSLDSHLVS